MSYSSVSPRLIETIVEIYPNEKFNDGDVIFDWMDSALAYMKENVENGTTNDFVDSMNRAYREHGRLSKSQIRGLLNCIRAEVLSADKQADTLIQRMESGYEPLNLSNVPSGRYAIPHGENSDGLGTVAFYTIDNIKDPNSKWFNWVFVNILASDTKIRCGSQRPNQFYQGKHENLLRGIAKDPYAAAILFGKLIGKCSICGRTLTDPESIDRGIGPICADRAGFSSYEKDALKALGYGNFPK